MKILITGGSGFVGSSLATSLKKSGHEITVLDNLKRRGSELNVPLLKEAGVRFVHGDVRLKSDLDELPGNFDLLVEASAEPSVLAGLDGSPEYLLHTNLGGSINCLEFARKRCPNIIFLSTSRVYSIPTLKEIPLKETEDRFSVDEEILKERKMPGLSSGGINEDFETRLPRSLYGASKLSSEFLVQEYSETYGIKAVINRCGVIAGPGQFGKVDQGVFTLWVANHFFGKPLKYFGFGGKGKQVRDLLHPQDLFELIEKQIVKMDQWNGSIFNVGGGVEVSTSLKELTETCRAVVSREVEIGATSETAPVDIPYYVSDAKKVSEQFDWQPKISVQGIIEDIFGWLKENEEKLKPLFSSH